MDQGDYEQTATQVGLIGGIIEDLDLVGMLNHIEHVHAIGPILDPTAYRGGMQNLEDMSELVGPLLKFQQAVARVKARHLERQARAAGRA